MVEAFELLGLRWRQFTDEVLRAAARQCLPPVRALYHALQWHAAPTWAVHPAGLAYRGKTIGSAPSWRAVIRRDPCGYCGGPGGTIDHVIARAAGGPDDSRNTAGACRACNTAKADRPLLVFLVARRAAMPPDPVPGAPRPWTSRQLRRKGTSLRAARRTA